MGLYDTVHVPEVCDACSAEITRNVQFKFGSPRLREYRVGQRVSSLGEFASARYIVEGVASACPACGAEPTPPDRAVWIEAGRLTAVRGWTSVGLFWDELYEDEATFGFIKALDSWNPGDIEE